MRGRRKRKAVGGRDVRAAHWLLGGCHCSGLAAAQKKRNVNEAAQCRLRFCATESARSVSLS